MSDECAGEPQATSLTLLQRVKMRDSVAWERLVNLYSPLIFHWAQVCGIHRESADDLAQEVWQAVSRTIEDFQRSESSGTFRGWLWTIARNKAHDHHRRKQLQPTAAGGTDAWKLMNSFHELEPIDDGDTAGKLLVTRALELVRPDFEVHTWQAFERMVLQSLPAAQVAEELGMRPNAVHQARFRVLRRLRQELAGLIQLPETETPENNI